jgi:c-di-GMP-binding flagellar brake protein YcgR
MRGKMEEDKKDKPQLGVVNFERRRSSRLSVDLPLEYFQVGIPGEFICSGRAGNASEGGLLLYLSEKLEVGQHLCVSLHLASEPGPDSLQALVQVVWVQFPFGKEGDHRYGVKFVDIPEGELIRLKKFLDNVVQTKTSLWIGP